VSLALLARSCVFGINQNKSEILIQNRGFGQVKGKAAQLGEVGGGKV